jgi:hypothetical protein
VEVKKWAILPIIFIQLFLVACRDEYSLMDNKYLEEEKNINIRRFAKGAQAYFTNLSFPEIGARFMAIQYIKLFSDKNGEISDGKSPEDKDPTAKQAENAWACFILHGRTVLYKDNYNLIVDTAIQHQKYNEIRIEYNKSYNIDIRSASNENIEKSHPNLYVRFRDDKKNMSDFYDKTRQNFKIFNIEECGKKSDDDGESRELLRIIRMIGVAKN